MSFGMIDTEVHYQISEVGRQMACGRGGRPAQPAARPAATGTTRPLRRSTVARPARRRRPGLRSRIGFTLVETGLHLITSSAQPSADPSAQPGRVG